MGGYVNSGIIFQLPIRGKGLPVNGQLFFDERDSDEKIIEAFVNSNLTQIQAIKPPTEDEIKILNEVFLKRPDIIFREYDSIFGFVIKEIDVSYLAQLTNVKRLYLDIVCEFKNAECIANLELEQFALTSLYQQDYGFLRSIPTSVNNLVLELHEKNAKVDLNNVLHLTELKSLTLRNIKKGIDKISEFKKLEELSLRSISIKDYSFLADMPVKTLSMGFQNAEYFNTFGINEKIENLYFWRNKNLTDLNFLNNFPNLKCAVFRSQKQIKCDVDLTKLTHLEQLCFDEEVPDGIEIKCAPGTKIVEYCDVTR